jgi:hypothetical protein
MLSNPLEGLGIRRLRRDEAPGTEYVMTIRPLQRILAFTGRSIDDVINNPIARREVAGYFKLHRQIQRVGEIYDLEQQWNPNRL